MGRIEDHYKEEIGGRDRGARNENASNTALGGVAVQPPPWSGLMSPMLAVKMPGGLRSWGRKSGPPGRLWWKKELSVLCASSYGEGVRGIRVPQFGFSLKSTQRRSKVVTVMVDWQLFITFNRFIRLLCRGLIRALFGWRGKRGKRGKSIYFLPQTSKHEVKLVEVNVLPLLFPLPLFRCQIEVKLV